MELNSVINLNIDSNLTILSDQSRIFKTELLIRQTKGLKGVDRFLEKISDGILLSLDKKQVDLNDAYIITLMEGQNSIFFKFGKTVLNQKCKDADIVFYKFIGNFRHIEPHTKKLWNIEILTYLRRNYIFFLMGKVDLIDRHFKTPVINM